MKFNFSDTKTGNQLLLVLCVLWLVVYWAKLFEFAWLFTCLGVMISITYQVDRVVTNSRNWEREANVPSALTLLVNTLFFICAIFALWEFLLKIMTR